MAKLKNIETAFTFEETEAHPIGSMMTVGNNRQVERKDNNTLICRLHGHPVLTVELMKELGGGFVLMLTANDCGYVTSTTRQAITDFLQVFGYRGSASIAGGVLHMGYHDGWGKDRTETIATNGICRQRVNAMDLDIPIRMKRG